MFRDRADAGKQLAKALKPYKGKKNLIVLAIPRGGVEVAYYIAKALNAKLSLLVVRKLPLPYNPEAGFGAIAENGSYFMQKEYKEWMSEEEVKQVKKEQLIELKRRVKVLRGGPLPSLKGKTVILVDDGIAMGSTMIAAINACRKLGAKRIIAASPVSSKEIGLIMSELVDELVVLETPRDFYAVAQIYLHWHDATDEEVIKLMNLHSKQ